MSETPFFVPRPPLALAELADALGATIPDASRQTPISGVAPLDAAGSGDLSFLRQARHIAALAETRAAAVLCSELHASQVPEGVWAVIVRDPQRAFLEAVRLFHPDAIRPRPFGTTEGVSPAAFVDPTANLEDGVLVEAGAVIGAGAEIGANTSIGPNAVIGAGVRIGRGGSIGPNTTIQCALVGDNVIIHPGVAIGQDGFGFAMGAGGHAKIPQVGRVIIQDDVEIGANTTVDRGSGKDTVIGKGTKIDNLVQIAHNVHIGCHCVLAAQVGISGSSVLQDYVVLGGKAGVADHLTIGMGAQVAGASNVADDIPPRGKWVGSPARPARRWMKELLAVSALAADGRTAARTRVKPAKKGTDGRGGSA